MDIFEFELRYKAYKGFFEKLGENKTDDEILEFVKISDKGNLEKRVQEYSVPELLEITKQTYTPFKKKFIEENNEKNFPNSKFSIGHYIERLEYELKVIKEMGYNTYFLIVADFINWARGNEIVVGPGRGSGAGSLLAYLIGITDVDPLPYDLLFERFLNPARVTMPDIDVDFEDEQREKVIHYVMEKYGKDKVSSIGTYMKLATKAAFKDVARVVGLRFEIANKFSSYLPDKAKISELISSSDEEYQELRNMYDQYPPIKQAIKYSEKLEGNLRQLGVHACGVIISPKPITEFSAVQYIKNDPDEGVVTQYDGPTLEKIGLLKMDFLGLRNLSIIKNCIKIITKQAEAKGKQIPEIFQEFWKTYKFHPPLDDKETYEKIFQAGNTTGVFQFESKGMRRFLVQLKPNRLEDIVAMNALYRPGPMDFIPTYIRRKHGEETVKYMSEELRNIITAKYSAKIADEEEKKLEEDLSPILGTTYGIAVYQEQLMFLVQALAGFSLAEADLLRRGVGKKKKEIIEKLKKEFIERGQKYRDYKPETLQYVYEKMIEPAASYSFNKSHSLCYSIIAFQTAWLKAHYPVEFYAALIRSVEEDTDTMSFYVDEAQLQGIEVLPPDINESFNHVAAIEGKIRLGFRGIKGIGEEFGEQIQQERQKNGKYTSLEDFLKRNKKYINKKFIEALAKSGALDKFVDRKTILENVQYVLDWLKESEKAAGGLFGDLTSKIDFPKEYESSFFEKLELEYSVLKTFVSAHPLDGLYNWIKSKFNFISQILGQEEFGEFEIVGFIKEIQRTKKKGFFIKIEDITGVMEIYVRELYNFKKFDMLIVGGLKKRSVTVTKIIKTTRDKLISLAGSKYDTELTVVKVRKQRKNNIKDLLLNSGENLNDSSGSSNECKTCFIPNDSNKPNNFDTAESSFDSSGKRLSSEKNVENLGKSKEELQEIENTDENGNFISSESVYLEKSENSSQESENEGESQAEKTVKKIKLPLDISLIYKIAEIVKKYPGEEEIFIENKKVKISKEGLKKINEILDKF